MSGGGRLDAFLSQVSKTSFTFQDNTAKHSAIAMAMCDVVVLVARDAETLRGQLSNPNLLQNLPSWAGDKPVICCVTRSDPAKFEEQRGDLAKIMTQFFPNSKATEVVFCNFMFSPEFKEGRDHLTQLFKMKPRRPDVKVDCVSALPSLPLPLPCPALPCPALPSPNNLPIPQRLMHPPPTLSRMGRNGGAGEG